MNTIERNRGISLQVLERRRNLSRQLIFISGAFIVIVALLLFINFLRLELYDPLESTAMDQLISRLAEDPDDDALKNDIRNLDLLARKAYFNSTWQINAGAYLLLFGAIIFIASLRFYNDLNAKITEPDQARGGEVLASLLTRKWILYSGGGLILIALGASFFSRDVIHKYEAADKGSVQQETAPVVERISITPVEKATADSVSGTEAAEAGTEQSLAAVEPESVQEDLKIEPVAKIARVSPEKIRKMHSSFRGPFGQGISFAKNIPVDWDGGEGRNVLWKSEVPKPGYNSPVIWEDKLFVSGGDASERAVYCFDRNTGRLLWTGSASGIEGSPANPPKTTDDTGLSAPTLAVDDNGVFAIFATGDVVAFNLNGKRLWAKNIGVPQNHYGHSSSLLTWDGKLFIQYDTGRGGRMIALSELDGSVIWDINRDNKISWSSPILIERDGKYEIVTSSDPNVAAYDPADGSLLWSVKCLMGEVAPSPGYGSGLVFAANEYASLVAIKPGPAPEIVWEDSEYLPEVSSPVVFNDLLFVTTSYGVLVCYDAKTGEKQWEKEYGGGFYSSPMVADGKVYAIDMSGVMHVIKSGREGTVLGEPKIGERAFATPAFTDGRIYIRGEKYLYCIGK